MCSSKMISPEENENLTSGHGGYKGSGKRDRVKKGCGGWRGEVDARCLDTASAAQPFLLDSLPLVGENRLCSHLTKQFYTRTMQRIFYYLVSYSCKKAKKGGGMPDICLNIFNNGEMTDCTHFLHHYDQKYPY